MDSIRWVLVKLHNFETQKDTFMRIKDSDTFGQVKESIQHAERVNPRDQVLIYAGHELPDHMRVSKAVTDFGLSDEDMILLLTVREFQTGRD